MGDSGTKTSVFGVKIYTLVDRRRNVVGRGGLWYSSLCPRSVAGAWGVTGVERDLKDELPHWASKTVARVSGGRERRKKRPLGGGGGKR